MLGRCLGADAVPYKEGHRGCRVNPGGGAMVRCSTASSTRNGLDLSESRAKRHASCLIHGVNLQALRSLNTSACSRTWLSRREGNMPSCIVPSFQPCKVRPSQESQSVPSEGGREGRGGEGKGLREAHAQARSSCLTRTRCERRVKAVVKPCLHSVSHFNQCLVLRGTFRSQMKITRLHRWFLCFSSVLSG